MAPECAECVLVPMSARQLKMNACLADYLIKFYLSTFFFLFFFFFIRLASLTVFTLSDIYYRLECRVQLNSVKKITNARNRLSSLGHLFPIRDWSTEYNVECCILMLFELFVYYSFTRIWTIIFGYYYTIKMCVSWCSNCIIFRIMLSSYCTIL